MCLITIAIPTYNNDSTVERTIDSCLGQSDLQDVEILVVNNASTDKTSEVLNGYGERIRVVVNVETVSLFENHNVALKNSRSKFVLFCHSDDILLPGTVKSLKRKIEKRGFPDKYICWGHSLFRDFYPSLLNANFSTGQVFAGIYAVTPFLGGGLTPSGTCYSSDFIEIGGFLPTQHKLAPSDATSMINAALNGFRFEMMPDILFLRTTASTMTRTVRRVDVESGYENAFDNLFALIDESSLIDMIRASQIKLKPPLNFFRQAAKIHPKEVLRGLLQFASKQPKYLFYPPFVKSLLFVLRNLMNLR